MKICNLLNSKNVLPHLKAENKDEVIAKLIETLSGKVENSVIENVREAVFERENIMSTGVGKGLAIPHGKAKGLSNNYAAFALLDEPVPYEAIDGMPVKMVFLLVGPETHNSTHIKMLSRISRLMNNAEFREQLQQCETPEDIIDAFKAEEEQYFDL
ncbi:MAG TPA: PTS sugar transporter subunit IIA [Balneolales bacterium]|nr:PTS sugar transporter subunit IIA [Balneolales bacterium]